MLWVDMLQILYFILEASSEYAGKLRFFSRTFFSIFKASDSTSYSSRTTHTELMLSESFRFTQYSSCTVDKSLRGKNSPASVKTFQLWSFNSTTFLNCRWVEKQSLFVSATNITAAVDVEDGDEFFEINFSDFSTCFPVWFLATRKFFQVDSGLPTITHWVVSSCVFVDHQAANKTT